MDFSFESIKKRRWCSSAKKMQKEAFFQRKGRAEVEGNDSNDTLVLDDDTHKVNRILAVTFSVLGRSY